MATATVHRSRTVRASPTPPIVADAWGRIEVGCFDLAVVLAVVAMPLAMGGRHPFGQVVLTGAALAATAAWTIRACRGDGRWQVGVVDAIVFAGLSIGVAQVLPLPRAWIETISPRLFPLLPCLDGGPRSFGTWECLSLAPGETLACLGILLAQGVFVAVLVQRTRTVHDADRVLAAVTWAMGILAAVGIAQYLTGNGRYLWFYEFAHNDAGGVVKGTFTNRNHFAGFLAIGCGTLLARAVDFSAGPSGEGRDRERFGVWLLLAMVAFAALSSLSRGGSIAFVVAVAVGCVCLMRSTAWKVSSVLGLVAALVLVAVALGIHGWERLSGRFELLWHAVGGDDRTAAGLERLAVWRAACRTIADFPWLGTGAGSHAEVAPMSMPPTGSILFTHAENSLLNLGVETGLVGLGLAAAAVAAAVAAAWALVVRGEPRERRVGVAVASGLAAGIVHSLADFTWYVPACSTLLATLGGCGVALASRRVAWLPSFELRLGRVGAMLVAAGVAILLCGTAARQIAAGRAEVDWEQAVKLAREIEAESAGSSGSADHMLEKLDARIAALERCAAARPDHPRARAAAAVARLERFGRARFAAGSSLGLVDLRLAAEKARFASVDDLLGWVRRAAGPQAADLEFAFRDAVEAIRVSPMAGEAWCCLAHLAFLAGRPEAAPQLVAQAVLVRPSDSLVLYEAANQAAIDADPGRAAGFWRASFAADPRQRSRIIAVLLPRISSAEACALLEPDLDGLRAIEAAWAGREADGLLEAVRERRLERVFAAVDERGTPPSAACRLLVEAAGTQQRLGRPAEAFETLQRAVRSDPSSFDAHRAVADAAVGLEDWATAVRELEWCLLRRPDRIDLREKLGKVRARPKAVELESAAATGATRR